MVGGGGTLIWPNLIKSHQVGPAIVYQIDDSRSLISSHPLRQRIMKRGTSTLSMT